MKTKSFRKGKDWKSTWLQTALSIVALLFLVLVNVGVLTPDQAANAQPLVATTLGAVSTLIAGVAALIGVFVKQGE